MSRRGISVAFGDAPHALLRFSFDAGADAGAIVIACPRIAGPVFPESWCADTMAFSAVAIEIDENNGDIERAAREGYAQLLGRVRGSAHPYLIRVWNYFDAINEGEGDAERYRRFCIGRAAAVDAAFNSPPPAATGIGHPHHTGKLHLVALCSAAPGIALENPRQVPAWTYPRDYGPVAPGFSRGALAGEGEALRLLASGTASIVGHRSLHEGDAAAQTQEALLNLEALLQQGNKTSGRRFELRGCEALRVYLRDPADLAGVAAALERSGIPTSAQVFLHGDICRRELAMELEGVFAPEP